jgi:type I restriction enzyme S subunit
MQRLLLRDMRNFSVLVPEKEIQRRIVNVLSVYDDLIEVNRRRIAILEEISRRLFDEWIIECRFPASEGVNAGGSRKASLHDLVEDIRDPILPSQAAPDTPYVGLEHMPRRSTTLTSVGRVDQVESTKLIFHSGDILFGKIRPYFHKVVHAASSGVTSSDSIVMRPRCAEFGPLAICLVSSDAFVAHAVQTSNGTKMPRANWNVLKNYSITIPPESLLGRFASIVGAGIELCSTLAKSNRNLQITRDLLLPRLISGEIDANGAERLIEQFTDQAAAE